MFVLFAIFMLSKSILGTSVSIPGVTPVLPLGSDPIILAAATSANDHPSRTTYTIIRTCFLTLFICIWQSTHSNMNAPRDSGIFCLYKKVNHALNTLLAPEMVLFFALRQRFEAKKIADRYNEEFVGNGKTAPSYPAFVSAYPRISQGRLPVGINQRLVSRRSLKRDRVQLCPPMDYVPWLLCPNGRIYAI